MAHDELKEEPILSRLRDKPGEPPAGLTSFVGLLGRSPKPGYWLLYLNLDMSRRSRSQNPTLSIRKNSRPSSRHSAVWAAHVSSSSGAPRSRRLPRKRKTPVRPQMNTTSTSDSPRNRSRAHPCDRPKRDSSPPIGLSLMRAVRLIAILT
jgi:hypothetical protein